MSQPTVAPTIGALLTAIAPSVSLAGDTLTIDDEAALRAGGIRDLAWTATFTDDEATRDAARWIVAEAASQLGCGSGLASTSSTWLVVGVRSAASRCRP